MKGTAIDVWILIIFLKFLLALECSLVALDVKIKTKQNKRWIGIEL
jgi:hypothetical protein